MSSAREAVERLLYRYAELIDAGDFAAVSELLGRCVLKAGGRTLADRDAAAVLRTYETTTRRYEDGTPRTRHVVTNVVVDVDEVAGAATSRSTFTVFQSLPDFPMQPIIGGRYHDRFVREAGAWRFDEREIVPELFGDLTKHLLIRV
jgi:3-phenylpropionate/cinnamic acid dioxygenase small subunit